MHMHMLVDVDSSHLRNVEGSGEYLVVTSESSRTVAHVAGPGQCPRMIELPTPVTRTRNDES